MEHYKLRDQRQENFENALLDLMETMPYDQITVLDLTRKLGVSRRSFYRVFECKEKCLNSLMIHMIQTSALEVRDISKDLLSSYRRYFHFWREHSFFLSTIVRNNLHSIFLTQSIHHIQTEEKSILRQLCDPFGGSDDDILMFYIAGYVSMVMNWASNGCIASDEEMAQKTVHLFRAFPKNKDSRP